MNGVMQYLRDNMQRKGRRQRAQAVGVYMHLCVCTVQARLHACSGVHSTNIIESKSTICSVFVDLVLEENLCWAEVARTHTFA